MREGISVEMSAADRARLEAVVADGNSPQKHVWRARIILGTADGLETGEIVRRTGKSKPCVWRWQERFMPEGVGGVVAWRGEFHAGGRAGAAPRQAPPPPHPAPGAGHDRPRGRADPDCQRR